MKKKPTKNNFPQSASSGERQISTETCKGGSLAQSGIHNWAVVAQMVKNPSAMRETWVQSLAWDNALEDGIATHSSILAWIIPWTGEPGKVQSIRAHRVGHD